MHRGKEAHIKISNNKYSKSDNYFNSHTKNVPIIWKNFSVSPKCTSHFINLVIEFGL